MFKNTICKCKQTTGTFLIVLQAFSPLCCFVFDILCFLLCFCLWFSFVLILVYFVHSLSVCFWPWLFPCPLLLKLSSSKQPFSTDMLKTHPKGTYSKTCRMPPNMYLDLPRCSCFVALWLPGKLVSEQHKMVRKMQTDLGLHQLQNQKTTN